MSGPASPRPAWRRPVVLIPALSVAALAAAVPSTYVLTSTGLTVTGPADGALVGAAAAEDITFRVVPSGGSPRDVTLAVDGKAVRAQVSGNAAVLHLRGLQDGKHTLTARTDGSLPAQHSTVTRTFTVDTTAPTLRVTIPQAGSLHDPVTLTGTAVGATAVTSSGKPVALHDGKFTVTFATPPAGVVLVARDAAGNRTSQTVDVPVRYPDKIRAVHETGLSWTFDRDRNEALALARAHKINAIELDIKDEDGALNFDPHVALASRIGAVHHYYDAAKVSRQLHALGVRLIGRIVTFKDPRLASWAWKHGHQDWVIQTPGGEPWGGNSGYGAASFTNFANETVHQYNLDVAKAAAKAGFDDVIFDYIRRPDGPFGQMRVPGMTHSTTAAYAAINKFSQQARAALRPLGAFVGAALFAQAAAIPQDTAQNVPDMAKYLDVVTPMDYPSHWLHGEYGVPNPNAGPQATHDIVYRSLKSWTKAVKGTDADVVPWLQCEDWGGAYSPQMVASQIQASQQNNMPGFILWNANAYYAKWESALTPDAPNVLR